MRRAHIGIIGVGIADTAIALHRLFEHDKVHIVTIATDNNPFEKDPIKILPFSKHESFNMTIDYHLEQGNRGKGKCKSIDTTKSRFHK